MLAILFLLIPSLLFAAQPQVVKEEVTIASKTYPAGETLSPFFNVPLKNTGVYRIVIPCDPKMSFTVQFEDDKGGILGRFGRVPGICREPTISVAWRRPAIADGTQLRVRLNTSAPLTKEISITFDKTQ